MEIRTVKQIEHLVDQIVLLRVDFNVPIEGGKVKEDFKIVKSLPTIKYLIEKKARIIVVSHLGRPSKPEPKYSLAPVREVLEKLLQIKIKLFKLEDLPKLGKFLDEEMIDGEVVMLENIRFSPNEEKNTGILAKELGDLAELFVLDGFAVAHRSAASVSGVARYLPSFAGLLLEKEIFGLSKATENPRKPFVVVLGGVKMETKIPVLKNLLPQADKVLLGGGLANTFFAAKGYAVGNTLIDEGFKKEILSYAGKDKVIFPVDVVVGEKNGKNSKMMKIDQSFKVSANQGIYDIGPETIKLFSEQIK
ncbi:MAG TPA: phosphoglycerate kinase, partial [Patescibacteria group bacterium]|nr:phosphoglycerate kinase [Patescibacteria group bacterium]